MAIAEPRAPLEAVPRVEPRVFAENETVSLPDLIPGLQLSLRETFCF
jgi:hypothetical protein